MASGNRLGRRLAGLWYGSPLYALSLPRQAPLEFPSLPEDAAIGSSAQADRLFQGRFNFAGTEIVSPHAAPWHHGADLREQDAAEAANIAAWAAELHGFGWIADFVAQGGDTARRMCRSLVQDWLKNFPRWDQRAWDAPVLGRRLASWLGAAHFLLDGADAGFAHDFLLGVARQARHLGRVARREADAARRAEALLGLTYAAECLEQGRVLWPDAAVDYTAALEAQLATDGGPLARNPLRLFQLLRDAVLLQRFLRLSHPDRGGPLLGLVERMAPMLRFFRHGDGGLALFHGGEEGIAAQIDRALAFVEVETGVKIPKPPSTAAASGFERAAAKRALLLLDAGMPPPAGNAARPHRAPLSFEFSHGKDRLIVNCGALRKPAGEWTRALSGPAAHSTLEIEGMLPAANLRVSAERHEEDGHIWIDAEHDGWRGTFGLLCRRRLYLAAGGEDLRAEELLEGGTPGRPLRFSLRLHLHPGVQASLIGSGDTVLLKTASGQGWRWRGAGGVLTLEQSVYFGQGGEARRAQQIVLTGSVGAETRQIKWALTRMGSPNETAKGEGGKGSK